MNKNVRLSIAVSCAALVSGAVSFADVGMVRIPLSAVCAGLFFFVAFRILEHAARQNLVVEKETASIPELLSVPVGITVKPATEDPRVASFKSQMLECSTALEHASEDLVTLHAFVDLCRDSSSTLQSLSSDTHFLQENANHTYAIADNLAKATDPAFALAGQVQATVSTLGDELAVSLTETETLLVESGKISQILVLMSEISSKTHVLSINASIVAARAGVHGKAFDVVAREIRHLAQGTEESLKSIESLISQLQERIMKVVARTRDTSASILQQKEALLSVAGVLQGVILSVEVIRTTSSVSSEKAEEQGKSLSRIIERLEESFSSGESSQIKVEEIQTLLERLESDIRS